MALDVDRPVERREQMTYQEYLDLPGQVEWVAGEAIIFMPPKKKHQELVGLLNTLMVLLAEAAGAGTVLVAPFEMKIHPGGPSREPDLLFVRTENLHRLTAERLVGPADLIIEILSDDSVGRDRGEKFDEYQEGGVSEYWIIDPRPGRERIDAYTRSEGRFRALAVDHRGRFYSETLAGLWIEEAWLTSETLPQALPILAEMLPPRGL